MHSFSIETKIRMSGDGDDDDDDEHSLISLLEEEEHEVPNSCGASDSFDCYNNNDLFSTSSRSLLSNPSFRDLRGIVEEDDDEPPNTTARCNGIGLPESIPNLSAFDRHQQQLHDDAILALSGDEDSAVYTRLSGDEQEPTTTSRPRRRRSCAGDMSGSRASTRSSSTSSRRSRRSTMSSCRRSSFKSADGDAPSNSSAQPSSCRRRMRKVPAAPPSPPVRKVPLLIPLPHIERSTASTTTPNTTDTSCGPVTSSTIRQHMDKAPRLPIRRY